MIVDYFDNCVLPVYLGQGHIQLVKVWDQYVNAGDSFIPAIAEPDIEQLAG
jgi:hypothetical protein